MGKFRGESPPEGSGLTPRAGLYSILLVTALAVIGLITAYDGTLLPNDTAQYLSVARHLVDGEGLKTDLVFFAEHLALGTIPVEQTVFPPGYPLLISIPASLGLSVPDAAFVVTASAFAWVPVVLYLLGLGVGQRPAWALTSALLWIGLVDNWFITWERQSEMPFILFTLLALIALPRDHTDHAARPWVAGLLAAAAVLTRYAGVFFVLAVVAVLGLGWIKQRSWRSATQLGAFLVGPVVATSWLFWRNLQLVGDFRGGNAYQEIKPVGLVVLKFYKSVCQILGFTGSGLRSFRVGEVLLVVSFLAILALWARHRRGQELVPASERLSHRDSRLYVAAAYVAFSVVLLFCLELTTSLEFQPRMVLVLVPFFMVIGAQLLSTLRLRSNWASTPLLLLGILLVVTFVAGQRSVVQQMRSRPNLYLLVDQALSVDFDDSTVKELLRKEISAEHPLMGTEPQMLGAVLAAPVVGLEPPYYTGRTWTAEEVRELVERYQVEYVVLIPELLEVSSERPGFFTGLENAEPPAWLEVVLVDPALRLFRVRGVER